jgi:hypothetical protein
MSRRCELQKQREPSVGATMEEAGKTTISRILRIVAGDAPIPHGVDLIAQEVVIHMDGHTFTGINTWANWISFLQTRNRVSGLDVEVETMVRNADGTITASGRWKAQKQGQVVFSKQVAARYRVVDGVVVEIWTTRSNYAFIVGPLMRTRIGHLLVMLHVFFWSKSSGVPDLRTAPISLTSSAATFTHCEESAAA